MPQLYRVWYRNGTERYSILSMALSPQAMELTERGNPDFLWAEPTALTQAEVGWYAEHLGAILRMTCDLGSAPVRRTGMEMNERRSMEAAWLV